MQQLRRKCLKHAKQAVRDSVDEDDLIKRAISMYDALDEHVAALTASLQEWYGLYAPEPARAVDPHDIPDLAQQDRGDVLNNFDVETTMGADLADNDVEIITTVAASLQSVQDLQDELHDYLTATMQQYCYNTWRVADTLDGARLLREAGSLRQLAMMPSSKIQILGAEEALFRHIKTGAKPPKYGHLFHHELVQAAEDSDRGKVARHIADKLAIAARTDEFSDKQTGDALREELEERHG